MTAVAGTATGVSSEGDVCRRGRWAVGHEEGRLTKGVQVRRTSGSDGPRAEWGLGAEWWPWSGVGPWGRVEPWGRVGPWCRALAGVVGEGYQAKWYRGHGVLGAGVPAAASPWEMPDLTGSGGGPGYIWRPGPLIPGIHVPTLGQLDVAPRGEGSASYAG